MQVYSYDQCIHYHRHDHTYLGFIDIDEFVFIKSSRTLKEILQSYESDECGGKMTYWWLTSVNNWTAGLTLNWMIYGSSGHQSRPQGGVLKNYNQCTRYDKFLNKHFKSFVQTKYVNRSANSPHWFYYHDQITYIEGLTASASCLLRIIYECFDSMSYVSTQAV